MWKIKRNIRTCNDVERHVFCIFYVCSLCCEGNSFKLQRSIFPSLRACVSDLQISRLKVGGMLILLCTAPFPFLLPLNSPYKFPGERAFSFHLASFTRMTFNSRGKTRGTTNFTLFYKSSRLPALSTALRKLNSRLENRFFASD